MKVTAPLPPPSTDAIHHSDQLKQRICDEIKTQSGSISFRKYMEMALYEPGLGYYVAGKRKLGEGGDFITAPEVSSLFSQCIANQCNQVLESLADSDILEFGAGSGTMAADILLHLESINSLPEHYFIIDLSPELKVQQQATLKTRAPHLLSRVQWLSSLPDSFTGVILANEVLDAMPVEIFHSEVKGEVEGEIKGEVKDEVKGETNTITQQHVIWDDEAFKLVNKPANASFRSTVERLNITQEKDYSSEFNPNTDNWIKQLEETLQHGLILLIDYGYTRQEYYHPDRNTGTLICHYQHHVHNDFFWYPSLQDITANVDFTHIAEAADSTGLTLAGFTSQAAFLTGSGLEEVFIQALKRSPDQQYPLAQQVRTLSLPSEMGERFKVIALSKGLDEHIDNNLVGFSTIDYRHKL